MKTTAGRKFPPAVFSPRRIMDDSLAARFAALYPGYEHARGVYDLSKKYLKIDERGKKKGRAYTTKGGATLQHYKAHLEGKGPGLGIIMLQNEDDCSFGVIDLDIYSGLDYAEVERRIEKAGLPLVPIISKSGGAHLTVYTESPIPAVLMQRKLAEWCAVLGFAGDTEIFPKQLSRANEEDVGNWINLPYYNAAATERAAYHDGELLSIEAFLDFAEAKKTDDETGFGRIKYSVGKPEDPFFEGPPCLQHLHSTGGFVEGTKRQGMFNVGRMLKSRYLEDWPNYFAKYNELMCNPPLRNDELQEIIKSLKKKDYGYQCKQPPIVSCCQRKLCLSRKYGVGDTGPETYGLEISAITCYRVEGTDDPPMWSMEIAGRRIMIDNNTFYEKDAFNKAVLAAIQRVPIHVPPARWTKMVDELAANADIVYTPKEASATGNLWEWITGYLQGAKCTAIEQIATGGVFLGESTTPFDELPGQFAYFRVLDLFRFLDVQRVQYRSKQVVFHLLTEHGGMNKYRNFKKGGFNIWRVPAPSHPGDEAGETPDFEQTEKF